MAKYRMDLSRAVQQQALSNKGPHRPLANEKSPLLKALGIFNGTLYRITFIR